MAEKKPKLSLIEGAKERVEKALQEIRAGRMVVLVDDEDRENEGDLAMAAEKITPEAINFMAKFGRGLICLSLTPEKCDDLGLSMMVNDNTSQFGTGFTISIDAREGVTSFLEKRPAHFTMRPSRDMPTVYPWWPPRPFKP